MSQQTLKQQLSRLHEELASGESLDPETRELLARVSRDIERVLDEEDVDVDRASIMARVETAALDFEASHPRLSRFLSEITDTLAKLGV
jgi:preprotein translocase subunit SecA